MTLENTVSSDFDPRSSLVESVFDWRLFGVITTNLKVPPKIHAVVTDVTMVISVTVFSLYLMQKRLIASIYSILITVCYNY